MGGQMSDPTASDPGIWLEGGVLPRRWNESVPSAVAKVSAGADHDLVSNYEVDGIPVR